MFGFGIWELLIILVIVIVLFANRLPQIGEGLGKGIRSFKKSIREPDEVDVTPDQKEKEEKKSGPS